MKAGAPAESSPRFRASQIFKVRSVWVPPRVLVAVLVFVMTLVYFGSVVDPAGHLHGLPVAIVDEATGATVGSRHVELGHQVAAGLVGAPAVASRLSPRGGSLAAIKGRMDVGKAYAAVVI